MNVFIDESGLFTHAHKWSVVCSLCLPSREVGPARRRLTYLSRTWPRLGEEIKGSRLSYDQVKILTDELYARDAILHCVAIDVGSEQADQLLRHKQKQCEGITAHITDEHHEDMSNKLWSLRRILESMPMQLYIQSVAMSTLAKTVVEQSTAYFAQRRPRELASYKWKIDAKDPVRVTTQEGWWRDTLGPLLESGCLREPLKMVRDKDFDYSYFDKSFSFQKQLWRPNRERELITGYDIGKIISTNVGFEVSHSDILLQAADVMANMLRRIMNGEIDDPAFAQAVGRIQVMRKQGALYQSVHAISLSHQTESTHSGIGQMLGLMSRAGRPMIRQSNRTKHS